MLDQGLRFRYAAISMNDRLQHKGKHRKCRVPECHLPSRHPRDEQAHCDGPPHNCGNRAKPQLAPGIYIDGVFQGSVTTPFTFYQAEGGTLHMSPSDTLDIRTHGKELSAPLRRELLKALHPNLTPEGWEPEISYLKPEDHPAFPPIPVWPLVNHPPD